MLLLTATVTLAAICSPAKSRSTHMRSTPAFVHAGGAMGHSFGLLFYAFHELALIPIFAHRDLGTGNRQWRGNSRSISRPEVSFFVWLDVRYQRPEAAAALISAPCVRPRRSR
jgi:hypothetical protein